MKSRTRKLRFIVSQETKRHLRLLHTNGRAVQKPEGKTNTGII